MKRCDFCNQESKEVHKVVVNWIFFEDDKVTLKIKRDFHRKFPSFNKGTICEDCQEGYYQKEKLRGLL